MCLGVGNPDGQLWTTLDTLHGSFRTFPELSAFHVRKMPVWVPNHLQLCVWRGALSDAMSAVSGVWVDSWQHRKKENGAWQTIGQWCWAIWSISPNFTHLSTVFQTDCVQKFTLFHTCFTPIWQIRDDPRWSEDRQYGSQVHRVSREFPLSCLPVDGERPLVSNGRKFHRMVNGQQV